MAGATGTIIFLGFAVYFVIWFFVSREFYRAAEMKGYEEIRYFVITFLLGIVGILLIIALPDRSRADETQMPPQNDALPRL